jgi:hypothetical protein
VGANAGDAHAQTNAQVALALVAKRLVDKAEARQALEAARSSWSRKTALPCGVWEACW